MEERAAWPWNQVSLAGVRSMVVFQLKRTVTEV
jgi:hypothetical protein